MKLTRWIVTGFLLAAPALRADEAIIIWQVPGCYYPVLGWRMPVDMERSADPVDTALRGVVPTRYNCHFYTRLHLLLAHDAGLMHERARQPRHDLITTACLEQAGWRRLVSDEVARPGDIVVAGRPEGPGGLAFTHSALVEEVDGTGGIARVRQKFDGAHPVVDVDWIEFRMLYAGMHPYRTEIWTRQDAGYAQVARR